MTENQYQYWLLVNERLHIWDKCENGTATVDEILRLTIINFEIERLKKLI